MASYSVQEMTQVEDPNKANECSLLDTLYITWIGRSPKWIWQPGIFLAWQKFEELLSSMAQFILYIKFTTGSDLKI